MALLCVLSLKEVKISRGNKAKQLWMAEMAADSRGETRAQLSILEDRVNFLRNKRFLEPSDPNAASSLIRPKQRKPKEFGIKVMPEPMVYVHGFTILFSVRCFAMSFLVLLS